MRNWLHGILLISLSAFQLPLFAAAEDQASGVLDNLIVLAYHDVREDIKRDFAADQFAISAQNLAMQFSWLHDQGYTVVSIDQVLKAMESGRPLPLKSVLLSFDDGLESVYSRVYPLLKLFQYPALIGVVSSWIESDVEVLYENRQLTSRDFLTWAQIREMRESGLIEIGSHSHDMHHGVLGNPQGNQQPAGVTRIYAEGYERHSAYLQRIEMDLAQSARQITELAGAAPRVVVWPYGQYNSDLRNIAAAHGMIISFGLDRSVNDLNGFPVMGRELIIANPGIGRFAAMLAVPEKAPVVRAAQVDLDYVYDPDPEIQERNLGVLLDRIKGLKISHVYLQAFADPDGDGAADALYFPNRHLPVRADLFNRAAWQLKTRCGVRVFAWMPMTAFNGDAVPGDWRVLQQVADIVEADQAGEPRVSVFNAEARQFVRDIYADLAVHANFEGIHFHDDGRLNDFEDASSAALSSYREIFGEDFTIAAALDDPNLQERWTALKVNALLDFGAGLASTVALNRPLIKTSRNIFASALLDARSPVYLAQDYGLFLQNYDYVTVMAMPLLENAADPEIFYTALVDEARRYPVGLESTVFQLQAVDWSLENKPVPSARLRDRMRKLQSQGVTNLAYYPDDFLIDHPRFEDLRQGMSLATNPVVP